jgi:hypothetical protein
MKYFCSKRGRVRRFLLVLSFLVSVICITATNSFALDVDSGNAMAAVKKAEALAFPLPTVLNPVRDQVKDEPTHAFFNFGIYDLADEEQDIQDSIDEEALKPVLRGIRHTFVLKNNSKSRVTIVGFKQDCDCVRAEVVTKNDLKPFPATVEAGGQISIVMALDKEILSAGPVSISIKLYGKDAKATLATLTMKGVLDSGLNFSNSNINFGEVVASSAASRELTLNIGRGVPLLLPPGEGLRLVSTNPYVKVQIVPKKLLVKDVSVKGDHIKFPQEIPDELSGKVSVTFRVSLSPDAPNGQVRGFLRLIVPNYPIYLLVARAVIPLEGDVVGHIKASSPNLLMPAVQKGKGSEASTSISYSLPLTASSLKAAVSNKYFSVTLVGLPASSGSETTASNPPEEGTSLAVGESALQLKVTLSANAPVGQYKDKVVVTNSINKEKLELEVRGTVIK